MRFAKIATKVAHVSARGNKLLTDKEQAYPENTWRAGVFDELIRRGFIYEVPAPGAAFASPELDTKVTNVEEDVEIKPRELKDGEMLEEAELPEDSPLSEGEPVSHEDLKPFEPEQPEVAEEGAKPQQQKRKRR